MFRKPVEVKWIYITETGIELEVYASTKIEAMHVLICNGITRIDDKKLKQPPKSPQDLYPIE